MNKWLPTIRAGCGSNVWASMATLTLVSSATGQIATNNTEYMCSSSWAYSHNDSLASTVRSIQCSNTPTSNAHYYDLSSDMPAIRGMYVELDCVDFSIWSSENIGDQTVFVRVYRDLTPDDRRPSTDGQLLLGEAYVVLPPSTEGAGSADPSEAPGRSDGDLSVEIRDRYGSKIFLTPNTSFWIEIGHNGESRTRFATYNDPDGTGTIGERGDTDSNAAHAVTWTKSTIACGGHSDWVTQTDYWGGGPPGAQWNRDMPIQVHFDVNCHGYGGHYTCAEDTNGDNLVGVKDFLQVLTSWGNHVFCGRPWRWGDANSDLVVDVLDFLAVLEAWGFCGNPNDECRESTILPNFAAWIGLNQTKEWTIDGLLDGPPRPPTNDYNDVLSGPTTCGWHDYGVNGIPGGYRWGDAFGIDASTGTGGGDVWYRYGGGCPGPVVISTKSDCEPGRVRDTIIEVYQIDWDACPTDWMTLVACDDSSATNGCGDHVSLEFDPNGNSEFLIRIGGKFGEQGTGTLSITPQRTGTPDCNHTGWLDTYDICMGYSNDCNHNQIPDECEADCNDNHIQDSCELQNNDCDANGVPDECDPDCDKNGIPDACESVFAASSGPMSPFGGDLSQGTLIPDLPVARSDAVFSIYASADLAAVDQAIDVYADGWFLGRVFETSGADCVVPGQREDITFPQAYFNVFFVQPNDHAAQIELVPVGAIDPFACNGTSFVQVSLTYSTDPTPTDNGTTQDCNANGIWDYCDVNGGGSFDLDGDGAPDECGP